MTTTVALTTTFSPAPSCTNDFYHFVQTGVTCFDTAGNVYPCYYFHLGQTVSQSECWPPSYKPTGMYYSPGICPSGYTEASSTTVGEETQAVCCPSSYGIQTKDDRLWYSSNPCTSAMPGTQRLVYMESVPGKGYDTNTVFASEGLNAYGLSIRYREGDFPTASPTPSSLASATATPTETGSSTPTSEPSKSLSAGAAAGIAVGAVAAVAFLVALGFFFYRRRKSAQATESVSSPSQFGPPGSSPMGSYAVGSSHTPGSGVAYVAVPATGSPVPSHDEPKPYDIGQSTSPAPPTVHSMSPNPPTVQSYVAEMPANPEVMYEMPADNRHYR